MGEIMVVVGPPCAGKSTFVQDNAGPDDMRVDFDAIAKSLGSRSSHDAPRDVREAAFAAREAMISRVLAGVEPTAWVIHTRPTAEQRAAYERAGAKFIVLDPGKAEALARAKADGRPERTAGVIARWYDDPPALPSSATTQTPRSSGPTAQVAAITSPQEGDLAMSEAPVVPVVPEVPPVTPQVEAKPPWGSPEEFSPEKAWARIQALQAQKNDPVAAKELKELREFKVKAEDASRTEIEREQARAAAAEKKATDTELELARTKAAVKFGLDEDSLAALDGVPVDRIEAIAALIAGKKVALPVAPGASGQGMVGTPIGGPSDPIAALDVKIADATKVGNIQLAIALKEQRFALANAKN